jgi:sec-independent protein translocase protein TatA
MRLGPTELLIIFALVVLLFGAGRLPQLARSLGDSMKEFKKATRELDEDQQEPTPELKQTLRELRDGDQEHQQA